MGLGPTITFRGTTGVYSFLAEEARVVRSPPRFLLSPGHGWGVAKYSTLGAQEV